MFIKQISVFLENRPGRIAEITAVLAEHNINIRALSIADTASFGVIRLIVDSPDTAEKILKESGFAASIIDVIAIGIDDKPSGLASIMKMLYENGVGIEYMYAFTGRLENNAYVIVRAEDGDKAVEILKKNGIGLLSQESIQF